MKELLICFPLPSDNIGISYTALSIFKGMQKLGVPVKFITPLAKREGREIPQIEVLPGLFRMLPWRYISKIAVTAYHKKLMQLCKPGCVVDFWSDNPTALLAQTKSAGAVVIKEKFNCTQKIAKRILNEEYLRCGAGTRSTIQDASIATELEQFDIADGIMSPSPMVRKTLLDSKVAADKIIDTSFGWNPEHLAGEGSTLLAGVKRPIFLFVGTVCIRKGAHLLLQYWQKASVDGTLVFLGNVQKEMAPFIEPVRQRKDVIFLGHHEKAFSIFKESDVFCFPTLEEGGPLVTYEALGYGLPAIVSPMGAGAILRDGVEGKIIDPHDESGWMNAIVGFAGNQKQREVFSSNASVRAALYTWDAIAQQRYKAMMDMANKIAGT